MISEELLSEIDAGTALPLSQLCQRVPRTRKNRPATLSCLLRWVIAGAPGLNGERVKLEAARLGGRWISSPGALRRFILRQTPAADGAADRPGARTAAKRRRASDTAGEKLEKLGV